MRLRPKEADQSLRNVLVVLEQMTMNVGRVSECLQAPNLGWRWIMSAASKVRKALEPGRLRSMIVVVSLVFAEA